MKNCVRSARAAGVFKEFHVLTDRPLEGCECYDAYECDKAQGLFKLHYLKVGMSRLNFDCFIWLDADTLFLRNPVDILGALRRSPIHVPLQLNLAELSADREYNGVSCFKLRQLYLGAGVLNEPYASSSAFWIIRREAIEAVYDLAFQFVNSAREKGMTVSVDAALGYAMQLLCADPEAHHIMQHPELWGAAEPGGDALCEGNGNPGPQTRPVGQTGPVRPAIVHLRLGHGRVNGVGAWLPDDMRACAVMPTAQVENPAQH